MTVPWLLASSHLIGLGIGLVAVFVRALAFQDVAREGGRDGGRDGAVKRVLVADNFWGLSAIILISTGLIRAFAGFEKGSAYYLHSTIFWVKIGLLVFVLLLEIQPMITLLRWRANLRSGEALDTSLSPRFSRISYGQATILVVMIFAATAMARGLGY